MESASKSFEKALTFHLGILHNAGGAPGGSPTNSPRPHTAHARSPSRAQDIEAAARHASLLQVASPRSMGVHGNGQPRSDGIVRSGSPVDVAVATALTDSDEENEQNVQPTAMSGYRYESPQRPVPGLGRAQAKMLQASVLKSANYLQRLEEVTQKRYER